MEASAKGTEVVPAAAVVGDEEDQEAASSTERMVELTVEEIIERHVGAFGLSQLLQVFLVSISWVFDAQSTLVTIFTDAQPRWRCKVGETAEACASSSSTAMCVLDPGAWEWDGGRKYSTITEWGLICGHKFRAGIPASLFFVGSLVGSIAQGRMADTYLGRKKTLLLSCLLTSLTGFLTSLSPNVWIYSFLRLCNGFASSGVGICCLVLSTEVVGRKWRGQVGQYGFLFYTFGLLALPIIAYPSRSTWRTLYRITSIPPLAFAVIVAPFLYESPRWLALRGRSDDAMKTLGKLAKLNRRKLPKNLAIANPNSNAMEVAKPAKGLWSSRWAAKRMTTIMATGFGVAFVYYGVQLNVENLNFNIYLTVAVNGLMEFPAVFLGGVLLGMMDRRILFSSSALIAGATSVLCVVFEKSRKRSWGQLVLESVTFMAVSLAFDVLYIYCVELFPTNVRNFSVSMLRLTLTLGAAMAPQLVVLGRLSPAISFVVFGGLAMFSGCLTFWLPETRNASLYETLEQQEEEEEKLDAGGGAETAEAAPVVAETRG